MRSFLRSFGISPKRTWLALRGLPSYLRDRHRFRSQLPPDFTWGKEFPILDEKFASSGSVGAYFLQDIIT